jgi:Fic family protein
LAQDEGRPSRLYSLSARFMAVRDDYYRALEKLSMNCLDATEWLVWFLEQVAAACRASEQTIQRVLHKARFWMRRGQGRINDRQRKAICLMLDAGSDGFFGGMTNRKYANLNRVSPATAQRDLAELAQMGVLRLAGRGRGARYDIAD